MKDKIKHITEKLKNNKGAVIVEAAIVFPVTFFILLFIIFIGNLYYEQARVDDIVMRYAIRGAQCVADPFLDSMYKSDGTSVPTNPGSLKLEPYRYIFGFSENSSISQVETYLSGKIQQEINSNSLIFFNGTGAKYLSSENPSICYFDNNFLCSTFVVQVNYQVQLPISFMDMSKPILLRMTSRAEVPVSDTDEFIRNIDMAVDLIEDTKAGKAIANIFSKVGSFITNFANK
jgi:hypothetical protein